MPSDGSYTEKQRQKIKEHRIDEKLTELKLSITDLGYDISGPDTTTPQDPSLWLRGFSSSVMVQLKLELKGYVKFNLRPNCQKPFSPPSEAKIHFEQSLRGKPFDIKNKENQPYAPVDRIDRRDVAAIRSLLQRTIAAFATHGDSVIQSDGIFKVLADDDAREGEADADNYELSDDDSRKLIHRQIRDRRGQKTFRELLCNRFDNQCVVTKCKIVAVLEAAHIRPYRRIEDNDAKNGLLLRADIHTLFDLNLIGVEPETWMVRIHPKIRETYAEFDGRQLVMPPGITPSSAAVSYRFNQFQEQLKIWI